MAFSFGLDSDRRLNWVEHTGEMTLASIQALHERMVSQPDWVAGMDFYANIAAVDRTDLDFNKILAISDLAGVRAGKPDGEDTARPKVAVVAKTELQYGIARMYLSLLERPERVTAQLFQSEHEALRWLEVDFDSLDAIRETTLRARFP